MSWPRTYSGGGQIPPQGGQSNLPNQLVQMMQMQLQMQHNIQLQKQQQFNPPKSRDNLDNGKAENSNIGNTSSKPVDQSANKGDKKDTSASSTDNKNGSANKSSTDPKTPDLSNPVKQPSNKSHSNNANSNVNGANNQSHNKSKPSEAKIKIEPPSPQTSRQSSTAKGSLLGSAPVTSALLPNPPPPPPSQEPAEKSAFSNDSFNQSQDYNSGNQANRSNRSNYNNERQSQNNDYYQGGATDNQGGVVASGQGGGAGGYQGRGGAVGGHQGGGRWQNQQNSSRSAPPQKDWQNQQNSSRSDSQKDWQSQQNTSRHTPQKDWQNQPNTGRSTLQKDYQSQPDVKNFSTHQEASNDYNKGAGSGNNYQSNMADYGQHSRHGRNMNPGVADRSVRQPPPYAKREPRGGYYNPAGRLKDTLKMAFPGPITDLEPLDTNEKKFNAYSKVFVGNIPRNVEEEELLSLFNAYGEIGTTYINKDSSFGFLTFDYKANAAKAVREVDNKSLKNRYLKVRFAMINEGIRVKNLSVYISNELLEKAFAVFGPIESCRVLVDDRGNPKFEGIVIYKEKRSAALALKTCQEECFYLSGAMRPVIATPLEPTEDNIESYPESVIPQNDEYMEERKVPPHLAEQSSFEFEFGNQWKKLFAMYDEKKNVLDQDFKIELERLEKKMVLAKVEFETEKLRKELAEREAETAQLRRHFGADEFAGRSGSPAADGLATSCFDSTYNAMGGTATGYEDGYGSMDQRYDPGYDNQYSEGYGNVSGYNKASDVSGSQGAEFDRGYGQQPSSYGAGYGRDDYGREASTTGGYGAEPKYDRGYGATVADIAMPPDLKRPAPPQPPPGRQKYDSVPEPPSYQADPEPLMAKDPYQAVNKRPRY